MTAIPIYTAARLMPKPLAGPEGLRMDQDVIGEALGKHLDTIETYVNAIAILAVAALGWRSPVARDRDLWHEVQSPARVLGSGSSVLAREHGDPRPLSYGEIN